MTRSDPDAATAEPELVAAGLLLVLPLVLVLLLLLLQAEARAATATLSTETRNRAVLRLFFTTGSTTHELAGTGRSVTGPPSAGATGAPTWAESH
jgi:hypothetical protein